MRCDTSVFSYGRKDVHRRVIVVAVLRESWEIKDDHVIIPTFKYDGQHGEDQHISLLGSSNKIFHDTFKILYKLDDNGISESKIISHVFFVDCSDSSQSKTCNDLRNDEIFDYSKIKMAATLLATDKYNIDDGDGKVIFLYSRILDVPNKTYTITSKFVPFPCRYCGN